MKGDHYQLAVIGSGSGGREATLLAARKGLRTALVERDKIGGICFQWRTDSAELPGRSARFGQLTSVAPLKRLRKFHPAASIIKPLQI
jgi:thioredoxin reductase